MHHVGEVREKSVSRAKEQKKQFLLEVNWNFFTAKAQIFATPDKMQISLFFVSVET